MVPPLAVGGVGAIGAAAVELAVEPASGAGAAFMVLGAALTVGAVGVGAAVMGAAAAGAWAAAPSFGLLLVTVLASIPVEAASRDVSVAADRAFACDALCAVAVRAEGLLAVALLVAALAGGAAFSAS